MINLAYLEQVLMYIYNNYSIFWNRINNNNNDNNKFGIFGTNINTNNSNNKFDIFGTINNNDNNKYGIFGTSINNNNDNNKFGIYLEQVLIIIIMILFL